MTVITRILQKVTKNVDLDDLVDAAEVADLLGLSHRNAVSLYQNRYKDMPRPVVIRRGGRTLLWLKSEITSWAKQTGRVGPR